jgi:hypothetical protein
MKFCAKVVVATRQWPVVLRAFALAVGAHPDGVVIKLKISEDHKVAPRGCRGLARTNLGLDEDLNPMQQACKLEMWPLF